MIGFCALCFSSCQIKTNRKSRIGQWIPGPFASVLDKQPRMLTLALDSSFYLAYDLARCTVYKAWKGGVTLEGAAFTDKKNVQPTTWGKSYFSDSLHTARWTVT